MTIKIQMHVSAANDAAIRLPAGNENCFKLAKALLDAIAAARSDPHGVGLISIAVIDAPFDI